MSRSRGAGTGSGTHAGTGTGTIAVVVLACLIGCRQDMHDALKVEPLEGSAVFADGRGARPAVEGTIARGRRTLDPHLEEGRGPDGKPAAELPFPATKEVLLRGRERYDIFCAPCHGRTGEGDGMIVERGFPRPQSFHLDRLRAAPVGQLYDAVKNGFGVMPSYASQVPVRDRWAIVAYLRALQLSQRAALADVPPDERKKLEEVPR